jgi:CheY-like chemotaxis protein
MIGLEADMEQATPSFTLELRRVLNHLYDWAELRVTPLFAVFGIEKESDPSSSLRRLLTEAIESLKPGVAVPATTRIWRSYQLLHSRYIEQYSQKETANELGLSVRHLRREEKLALEMLSEWLWKHYNIKSKWQTLEKSTIQTFSVSSPNSSIPSREQELKWLQESLPCELVKVEELLKPDIKLIESLAKNSRVEIDYEIPESLPHLVVQPIPIQQALLNVFTIFFHRVPDGVVSVRAYADQSKAYIQIQAKREHPLPDFYAEEIEKIELVRQLLELSSGSLEIILEKDNRLLTAIMILQVEEDIPILVIDDNEHTLQLLERYLSSTRYRFVGTSNPNEAISLVEQTNPKALVLDVMMPSVDGWELLGRMREHPLSRDLPIIVCTILPQQDLAISLGAASFIQKPVSRKNFLRILDQQLGQV